PRLGGQNALQVCDERQRLLVLLDDLVPLELRQTLQAHVENRTRLDLGQGEARHQGLFRHLGTFGLPDQANHQVELIDRPAQSLEDVRALLGPSQVVPGPTRDDLAAEPDELLKHLLQVHDLRSATDQRQHDDAESGLHRRVLVELVDDDLRDVAAAQLEHDPDAFAARLVPALGNAIDLPVADQLADLLDERRLVHLVGQFGDDDGLPAAAHFLDVRFG